ncbi:MAG: glutaredoxin family protein [Candidatus Bathyarchaeia archaeon]|nr:glutaredoxin family protein [Candidatus Bathyarchaeota archaeon]
MVKVKIYTAPNCPYCKALKKFLKENNVPFEERDVSKDPKAVTELILKSNQAGVPVIEVNGRIIVGFNRDAIVKALFIEKEH